MVPLPADTLRNRTFVGLLIAQFLAAFNDQAIHASAMFFAINQKILTDAKAISLMPLLFFAPWAIFVTLAGYFADRYSKRTSLVFWKMSEIVIMSLATLGFWLGAAHNLATGPWIVLSCVFLMGMHSAFFVPAKYGAMPEILEPQLLARGNGLLESLSFLAVILGTVAGGLLTDIFHRRHQEQYIGIILLALAVIGAAASLMIQPIPPANSSRPFPRWIYGPLIESLRTLVRSRPLKLAMIGIAFFTFMVAFMRATVYMLGESQNPRWSESKTSIIVGATSLGIGLGAPLAGFVSGRKIELGLVPIGALGMALAAAVGGVLIDHVAGLVACIILIGFFTGFYLVPLFSLQQHRAPKQCKGDVIAANNFVNVIGAMLASALFYVVVFAFTQMGLARPIEVQDEYARGVLAAIDTSEGRLRSLAIEGDKPLTLPPLVSERNYVIESAGILTPGIPAEIDPDNPTYVVVAYYKLRGVEHYLVRLQGQALAPVYDTAHLPRYLFFGAGAMALITLAFLRFELPDLFSRMGWVLRNLGHLVRQNRLHVIGTTRVPSIGPVVLVTNCRDDLCRRTVVSATDRAVRWAADGDDVATLIDAANRDYLIALDADRRGFLPALQKQIEVAFVPVYFGPAPRGQLSQLAFGPALPPTASLDDFDAAIAAAGQMSDADH